jgi:TolA-binding protein
LENVKKDKQKLWQIMLAAFDFEDLLFIIRTIKQRRKAMKKFLCVGVACGALLSGYGANAADWDRELQQLREDVLVLQRQVYRGVESSEKGASAANSDFQVKVTNWEENVRQLNGRIDEMDYKVKEIDKKLDKINRDMEIRFKILEGRPVPADLSAPAPSMPQTYDAPVASD